LALKSKSLSPNCSEKLSKKIGRLICQRYYINKIIDAVLGLMPYGLRKRRESKMNATATAETIARNGNREIVGWREGRHMLLFKSE
jgi:hypothetical protein